jgi:hypothetical protein
VSRRNRRCALLLLCCLVAGGASSCGSEQGRSKAKQATATETETVTLVENLQASEFATQELELPILAPIAVSPSGKRLVFNVDEEICVAEVGGDERRCVDFSAPIDDLSLRWSNDESRVLFTESWRLDALEPDVWALEADAMELTNLTDDGVQQLPFDGAENAWFDTAASWFGDDGSVLFLRVEIAAADSSSGDLGARQLLKRSPDGELTRIATLPQDGSAFAWSLVVEPDAKSVLVTVADPDTGGQLQRIDLGSGRVEPLTDFDERNVLVLDVASDGRYALVSLIDQVASRGLTPGLDYIQLVDLDSGTATRLVDTEFGGKAQPVTPRSAVFSPDGATVLMLLAGPPDGEVGETVWAANRSAIDGNGQIDDFVAVTTAEEAGIGAGPPGFSGWGLALRVWWSADGLVTMRGQFDTLVSFRLAPKS